VGSVAVLALLEAAEGWAEAGEGLVAVVEGWVGLLKQISIASLKLQRSSS
jgi:hypothetical protein